MRTEPALSVVEAAYAVGVDQDAWLDGIFDAARPLDEDGLGVIVVAYAPEPGSFHHAAVRLDRSRPELLEAMRGVDAAAGANPAVATVLHRTTICETTSEALPRLGQPLAALDALYAPALHPLGVHDTLNIQGADPSGHALCIMCARARHTRIAPATRHVWSRVAVHLAAAVRLRRALGGAAGESALESADAVFDAAGRRVLHATSKATPTLGKLREAARAVDRSRSRPFRRDAPRALDLWQGLFAGRFSMVDVFDSDGRRFLVAHENEPAVAEDRRLTRRERQAVLLAATGHTDRLAAYALGVGPSTFRIHIGRAMRKLGVRSRAQLVELAQRLAFND